VSKVKSCIACGECGVTPEVACCPECGGTQFDLSPYRAAALRVKRALPESSSSDDSLSPLREIGRGVGPSSMRVGAIFFMLLGVTVSGVLGVIGGWLCLTLVFLDVRLIFLLVAAIVAVISTVFPIAIIVVSYFV
jgi:hypothetical protein